MKEENIIKIMVIIAIISTLILVGCGKGSKPDAGAPEREEQREEIEEIVENDTNETVDTVIICNDEEPCASGGQCFVNRSNIGENTLIIPEMCAISPIVQESQCECPEGLTCAANLAEGESVPSSWTCQEEGSGGDDEDEEESEPEPTNDDCEDFCEGVSCINGFAAGSCNCKCVGSEDDCSGTCEDVDCGENKTIVEGSCGCKCE